MVIGILRTWLIAVDEVSALVLDFGSHTTRAGYAGEDTPRVVCPSFYGYTDDASTSGEGMDVEMSENGNGNSNGDAKGKGKRKYYVGEDGVGVWRPGMEVGNFVSDGVGMSYPYHLA
jgi:actin-like protein 6A